MRYYYVAATPEVDRELANAISAAAPAPAHMPVRFLDLPPIDFAFDPRRKQYSSTAFLEMLVRECPPDAAKLLAVTGRDLFIPVLTFVYGQAQLGGRVAAISLARLRQEFYGLPPDREVLLNRARKEALHESGHLFGLVHCVDRTCAMALSTGIRQVDEKKPFYCAACTARLEHGTREPRT